MKKQFEVSEAITIIEQAFLPLECIVKLSNNDNRLHICVVDSKHESVLTTSHVTRRVRDPNGLQKFVHTSRNFVEQKGFKLQPWNLPS